MSCLKDGGTATRCCRDDLDPRGTRALSSAGAGRSRPAPGGRRAAVTLGFSPSDPSSQQESCITATREGGAPPPRDAVSHGTAMRAHATRERGHDVSPCHHIPPSMRHIGRVQACGRVACCPVPASPRHGRTSSARRAAPVSPGHHDHCPPIQCSKPLSSVLRV